MSMIHAEVTEDDIAKGVPNDPDRCAVARAMRRATGMRVQVNCMRFQFWVCRCVTPPAVKNFIKDFDDGLAVKPLAFDVPDLDEWR